MKAALTVKSERWKNTSPVGMIISWIPKAVKPLDYSSLTVREHYYDKESRLSEVPKKDLELLETMGVKLL